MLGSCLQFAIFFFSAVAIPQPGEAKTAQILLEFEAFRPGGLARLTPLSRLFDKRCRAGVIGVSARQTKQLDVQLRALAYSAGQ